MREVLVSSLIGLILVLPGCGVLSGQRFLYEQDGIRVGLESDSSFGRSLTSANSHPIQFTPEQIRQLLGVLEVTGYSGTVMALIIAPTPRPVFSKEELDLIARPIAEAFHQATPKDRIFFSIPNLHARYSVERTEGELFFRAPKLFILLKEHAAYIRTDTGGGDDERDPRDHQAMQLSVAPPLHAVTATNEDSPHWAPYERVHLALNVEKVFAAFAQMAQTQRGRKVEAGPESVTTPVPLQDSGPHMPSEVIEDLRLQVRELTSTNQDLRKQLSEQAAEIEVLKHALKKMKQDLDQAKTKLGNRRKPSSQ